MCWSQNALSNGVIKINGFFLLLARMNPSSCSLGVLVCTGLLPAPSVESERRQLVSE